MSIFAYVLTILLLVVTLFHYSLVNRSNFTIGDFLASPGEYAGELRSITGPYLTPADEGFVMEHNQYPILVRHQGEHPPPWLGEVSVYGILEQDGSITAQRIHNYDYNYVLYVFSFLAGIAVLAYLFYEWKPTMKGFVEKSGSGKRKGFVERKRKERHAGSKIKEKVRSNA